MSVRRATSIVETLVVIAIIGVLVSMLLPAVQSARRRALEVECKNNLRQINIAIADYSEAHNRLPGPGANGVVGGWTIDVLPFLDQRTLQDRSVPGTPISTPPDFLLRQPRILCCPSRRPGDVPTASAMEPSSYIFVPDDRRKKLFRVIDAPLEVSVPWASGPEMTYGDVVRQTGPHLRGFFYASGFQNGVGFIVNGRRE
jgi:type II secretory pathway pseudopilin PulG